MKRFFFDLCGAQKVNDTIGVRFQTELQAFRSAERLALELAETRPLLQGAAWIAVGREGSADIFLLSVGQQSECAVAAPGELDEPLAAMLSD